MRSVFFNGRVYTGDSRDSVDRRNSWDTGDTGEEMFHQAFLVEDGVITAVGPDSDILALADPDTVCIDMEGRFICPGFNDSHLHPLY